MIYQGIRHFEIPDSKPVFAAWLAEINITEFLEDDTIDDVVFTAAKEDGTDATSDVLTDALCTYDNDDGLIKPYIKAGASGETYICTMQVTTDGGSQEEFYLRWSVI
jgi:hypothetical protein